jgi:hypothetical protein
MTYQDNWGYPTEDAIPGREVLPDPPPYNEWPQGQMPRWTGFEWQYSTYPPEELTQEAIAKFRNYLITQCYLHAKILLDSVIQYWSDAEKATWSYLEKECLAFRNDNAAPGRFMQYEIDCGYRTANEIAERVLTRSTTFHPFRASVVAIRGEAIASILAMTPVQLYAVNIETDFTWPEFINGN